MLFIVNSHGVPSVAKMVNLDSAVPPTVKGGCPPVKCKKAKKKRGKGKKSEASAAKRKQSKKKKACGKQKGKKR